MVPFLMSLSDLPKYSMMKHLSVTAEYLVKFAAVIVSTRVSGSKCVTKYTYGQSAPLFSPNFAIWERKFHRSESSMERKFLVQSFLRSEGSMGAKVPRSESYWSSIPWERKFPGSESSLCGLFTPRNENAPEQKVHFFISSFTFQFVNFASSYVHSDMRYSYRNCFAFLKTRLEFVRFSCLFTRVPPSLPCSDRMKH